MGEGVEVVQAQELVADLFQNIEVGRPIGSHLILSVLIMVWGLRLYTSINPTPNLIISVKQLNHQMHDQNRDKTIHYYTSFYLFNSYESQLLYNYKYFIQNMIMRLGEDWRIQSNLLSQEIITLRASQDNSRDHSNFNLFNQFLSAYLREKIGKEHEHTNYSQSDIQKAFLETVNHQFHQQKIHNGLTFKTLSLGYCITATDVWNKTFKNNIDKNIKNLSVLKPFAKLCQQGVQYKNDNVSSGQASMVRRKLERIDIMSSHLSTSEFQGKQEEEDSDYRYKVHWQKIEAQHFDQKELKQIKSTIEKIPHSLKKTQVLSYFVSYIDQLHLKNGKTVRVFSLSNEFYLNAFIIWLIFNIKMFFSLNFQDYLRYFKELINQDWKPDYERPLKKFQLILEREWNKLLKDFTVALHDDQEVLNILVERVRKCIQSEWEGKIASLKESVEGR